jgi:glutamyl-tRNA synthetase
MGPGGGKLSKRHGAVSVEEYRDAGYLPHALVNYLSLLGWGPEDGREVLTVEELVAEFALDRVNPSAATFDPQKLEWMNGEHIRRMNVADLTAEVLPFAKDRYGARLDIRVFEAAVALAQERATTLVQIADQAAFLFVTDDDFTIADESWEKLQATDRVTDILEGAAAHIETCDWNHDAIDLRPMIDGLGLKPRKAMPALYSAIEGRHAGLPLFESIELLGRESSLRRLHAARERLGSP